MRGFLLTRYFTVLSFILIGLAGVWLSHFAHKQASAQLMHMAEDRNVAMTQLFRNALWEDFAPLMESTVSTPDALREQAVSLGLQNKAVALMRNSDAIKVKVYNPTGLTVFSSDPSQTGEDKRANAGFLAAVLGQVATTLTHRNQFDAFESTLSEIDVISSYVPVRSGDQIVGVIEVYQDVTQFIQAVDRGQRETGAIIFCVLLALYLLQLVVVRRAQLVLQQQSDELAAANRDLDFRVRDRTATLETTNQQLRQEMQERQRIEERLDHLAHHDPLTSLPNRLMFHEQLKRSLGLAQRNQRQLAILFIDLDRFKDVNDTLGHAIGDELLVAASKRLTGHLRTGDTLARLGGDEFVCVLEDIHDPHEANIVADKLVELLEAPFQVVEHELFVSASVGISLYPEDGQDVETLVRNADTAMYQAKAHGRGRSHFYAPEMTTYAQERIRLEVLLRRSIDAGEISVQYQLKVSAANGAPAGVEALARWNSAELGAVPPVRFIPIAEDTGFIVELGAWVLRTACRQLAAWRAAGVNVPKMSVNLSVKQLERDDVVSVVQAALDEAGLEPSSLELEVTESIIMAVDDAFSILEKLRALGVQIAVDDFGTGYSSLSYLKLLPIHTLKIDRAFVLGIGQNPGDEAIIRAIIAIASSLGLSTVAEGVDAEHQIGFLRELGCGQIQGYYYGKPQPAEEFAANWIKG